MKKELITLALLLAFSALSIAQQQLILRTTSNKLSIKDGTEFRENYWTISPENELDVYTADKTTKVKTVTFYSDIDSLSFIIHPREQINFIVLLNDADTCFHQIKSGITFNPEKPSTNHTDTIPFQLTKYNNISIQAVLNNRDTLALMFHTAANSIGLTRAAVEKIDSLNSERTSVEGNAWGGSGTTDYITNNTLQIGKQSWDKQVVWISENSGHFTDGKFGPHLFNDKIVEIDFEQKHLVVYSTLPDKIKNYKKHDLLFKSDMMFLDGTLSLGEVTIANKFLIHSGYSGALLLDDVFVNEHQLGTRLKVVKESELTDSYGNVMKTKKAILPEFQLDEVAFSELPVSFFEGAIGRQKMSLLGGDILKRFSVILDLQQAYIYLEPNELIDLPYWRKDG